MLFRCLGKLLFVRVLLALATFLSVTPLWSYADKHPKIWNLCEKNSFFVGREEELQKLASFFKPGAKKVAAITGGPGFGKTQTARQFAQKFRASYDLIWWFDANQDIPNQYEKLTLQLNKILPKDEKIVPATLSKEALVDTLKDILRVKNIKWLLIFDNAESYAHVEKFIPVTHHQPDKHILLTSRNSTLWPDKVEIGKFKRSESIQFVKQALPQETDANIENLVETLSDYPLGLTIAAAFIKTHAPTTIPKYLSLYLRRTVKKADPFIKTADPLLEGYANDAQTPLSISLKFIEQQSQEALNTLFFMSLLNSKDIPESYVDIWLEKTKAKLSPAEVIKMMNDQSLIEIKTVYKDNDPEPIHFFSLHDLIHQLIQESIPMEDKRKLIDSATQVMLEVFSGSSEAFTTKIMNEPIHLLQAQKLYQSAKEAKYSSPDLLKLKICMFQCVIGLRDFEEAMRLDEEIEAELKAKIPIPPYYVALYKVNKGFLASMSANYDDTIRYIKEGLALFESTGEHNDEVLRAIINLMQCYAFRGETDKADALLPQGKELFQHSNTVVMSCFFLYIRSLVLGNQGLLKEASEMVNKVESYPTLSTEYPPLDHAVLIHKTALLIKQGKLAEAEKALEICEHKTNLFFQGRNNTSLSHVLLLKSLIAIEKRELSHALFKNLEEALLIFNEFFKGEKKQRFQARTYFAMGEAYALKKDFEKALENYLTSDEVYTTVLKSKKIDDVSELYTALALLGIDMKQEKITSTYLNAHMKTFGVDHPRTNEIIKVLDDKGLGIPF